MTNSDRSSQTERRFRVSMNQHAAMTSSIHEHTTGSDPVGALDRDRGLWIGVDLDGTLAHYDGWKGPDHIGAPVPMMVERVRAWLDDGREVRVFTSRATSREHAAIRLWCVEHIGRPLSITNVKDDRMVELWDDRAVGVEFNTGVVRTGEREPR